MCVILLCTNEGLPPPAGTITCLGICSRVELQHRTQTVPIFTSAHLENIKTLQYLITWLHHTALSTNPKSLNVIHTVQLWVVTGENRMQ